MIGIINYRVGNLQNLKNSLDFQNIPVKIIDSPTEMIGCSKYILPGVGAFGYAAQQLKKHAFQQPLLDAVTDQTPVLGICVGMQLLFTNSYEEGNYAGLDLIQGSVNRFESDELKIPQIGWNTLNLKQKDHPLFKNIKNHEWFYFVHSYYCSPEDKQLTIAETEYACNFTSVVQKGNLFGVQFHPEKSQNAGLQLLNNFAQL